MVDTEKEIGKNPYVFSKEERTCPEGLSRAERRVWIDERIKLQQEGIEHGIRPQNLFGLPADLKKLWINQVWNFYLSTLPEEKRRIIKQTVGPGEEHHHHVQIWKLDRT
jgi:hypothetical protein